MGGNKVLERGKSENEDQEQPWKQMLRFFLMYRYRLSIYFKGMGVYTILGYLNGEIILSIESKIA